MNSDENYYQEETVEIVEEKKIFLIMRSQDEEQSMDEELDQFQEEVFDKIKEEKASLFFEEKNIGVQGDIQIDDEQVREY